MKTIICKCSQKNVNTLNERVTRYITHDLEISSDDSDESDVE